jgi:hypothetical protein
MSICGTTNGSSRVPVMYQLARLVQGFYTGGHSDVLQHASVPRGLRSLHLKHSACHPMSTDRSDKTRAPSGTRIFRGCWSLLLMILQVGLASRRTR